MANNVPLLDNEEPLDFGEEDLPKGRLKHPIVTTFHLFFRMAALIVYEFCWIITTGFIGPFILIIILLSLDFWTVKNITGRLMVGLRWWNYIDDEGQSHWVFEAKKGGLQGRVSKTEVRIFWVALVAFPAFWSISLLIAIVFRNFQWAIVVVIAIILSGSNLYGYVRCKLGKSDSISQSFKNMAAGLVQRQMVSNVTNMFTRAPPTATPSSTV